jgi:hypothetical protein
MPLATVPSTTSTSHRPPRHRTSKRAAEAEGSLLDRSAYALPEKFTLPELQRIHEVFIGKPLQKKSFRRRIEQADLLIDTGLKRHEGGRPAVLYKMRARSGRFTFVRNLEE